MKERKHQFRKKLFLFLSVVAWLSTSCERLLMDDDHPNDAVETFDYLWHRVDEQYSFFDVKHVDWQRVYDTLRPKVYEGMGDDSLFSVLSTMLHTLRDGHVNLYARYDVSHDDSLYYHFYANSNIDINRVLLNYLTPGFISTGGMAHHDIRDGSIIYIMYSSFSSNISNLQLKHIINLYPNAIGMILDLRGNGGGSIENIYNILSIMPNHGQTLYYTQIKNGKNHNDFTPLQAVYAPAGNSEVCYQYPVAVLVDRGSFSATSSFALCTQAYDNMFLVGDTTGGGLGLPIMGVLPNGWRYRFSITRTLSVDGHNYENGMPPDYQVILNPIGNADSVIEKAADLIEIKATHYATDNK